MKSVKYFLIIIFLISGATLFSQRFFVNKNVKIYKDPRVDSLLLLHRKLNEFNLFHEEHDGLDGYRVELFFESGNNSKSKTMAVKNEFLRRYSNVEAYVTYGSPYYRLKVGDFRSKLDAENFLQRIKRRYPAAYVVSTKIRFPKID